MIQLRDVTVRYGADRALRLRLLTVVENTLGRSREIAVAAECRACDLERSRPAPLRKGRLDGWLVVLCVASAVRVVFLG